MVNFGKLVVVVVFSTNKGPLIEAYIFSVLRLLGYH